MSLENNKDGYIPDISNLIDTKKCLCDYCAGYKKGIDEGFDVNWVWVRAALLKMMEKGELQDTDFIPKLQKVIKEMTVEEFKEYDKILT
ncbi:hypothetical protein LCGC14_0546670 [marine sediment metagenome]|uniref:Uncharacterized protein n=1 Tax=marine sediment metagenome TaxID=412755 RepID=A0A0F9S9P7_9ZZZZ